jgi:prepilin-type N-terminal cleavage/methylation domain-containing protein
MKLSKDNRGVTLVELIIAVSLLSVVLSAAYFLMDFSGRSFRDTEAMFLAQEDARKAIILMEDDIRKAQAVTYSGVLHKAAEVKASGMQLDVYTDVDRDGVLEMVQYKLFGSALKRGEAELGSVPAVWTTVVRKVQNNLLTPPSVIFSVSNEVVNINLIITDDKDRLSDDPLNVSTGITVRSKGAMD